MDKKENSRNEKIKSEGYDNTKEKRGKKDNLSAEEIKED